MLSRLVGVFFFNDTATTEIYTLSLHDALPICISVLGRLRRIRGRHCKVSQRMSTRSRWATRSCSCSPVEIPRRSEEHTSELQSLTNLVCRLLLEKKNDVGRQGLTR